MSAHPTQAIHPDDPGQPAAPAHPHRQALDDLITMGTSLARALHRQALIQAEAAQAAVPPHPAPHTPYEPPATALANLATAFDRIARAVRRCIALAQRLDTPPPPAKDPAAHRAAARKRILREVEDAIGRTSQDDRDAGDAESLTAELHDRLDGPDLDDDLASRPVADIITELCRDLGLAAMPGTTPWKRRTPADIAALRARAAAPTGAPQPSAAPPSAALSARPGTPQRAPTLLPHPPGPDATRHMVPSAWQQAPPSAPPPWQTAGTAPALARPG